MTYTTEYNQNDQEHKVKFWYTNADSVSNKIHEIQTIAETEKPNIMAITETLPKTNRTLDKITNHDIAGYTGYHSNVNRGVSIYVHSNLKSEKIDINSGFEEYIWVNIEMTRNINIIVGCIYRSPNSPDSNNNMLPSMLDIVSTLKKSYLVIVGDFNYKEIDWINNNIHTTENHPAYILYNKINDLFYEQLVKSPTRHRAGERPSLLDWIITDSPNKIDNIDILAPLGEKGDHNVISFDLSIQSYFCNISPFNLCYSRGNYQEMRNSLEDTDWATLIQEGNIENSWSSFHKTIDQKIEEHIPKARSKSNKFQPWINAEIKGARKEKNLAWRKYSRHNSEANWTDFTSKRNFCNRLIKKVKANFEKNLADDIATNPKKFWNYVNNRKCNDNNFPTMIDTNDKVYDTDIDKANQFNKYFCEVFTIENKDLPDFNSRITDKSLENITFDKDTIPKQLMKLNTSKAAGPDRLHPRILFELKDLITDPLSKIFTQSFEEGRLPLNWKLANVKPLFKKGKKNCFANYRPVSLTSVCCKIMERIIRDKLVNYLEINKLLSNDQHGFRSGRSCTTQLLEIIELWTSYVDDKKAFDCIYLDFAKAFDKVPHNKLLHKLKSYGIIGKLHSWISNFLTNREQRVNINGKYSETRPVTSGIPQGSVLGPILFIIYINDLPDQVNSYLKIFADDTKIFRLITDIIDRQDLQHDLNKVLEWSHKWQLPFNIDKCKVIHYSYNNPLYNYTLNNKPLTTDTSEKDLGVTFTSDLKFSSHIRQIISKANSRLGLIKNTFTNKTAKIIIPLYKSLVRPLLEYCVSIWNPNLRKDIIEIEKVQRRATKLIPQIKDLPYPNRLKFLHLDSLLFRRKRQDMIQVFRMLRRIDNIDHNIYFNMNDASTTRGHSLKILKPRASTSLRLNSFSHRVINDWNSLKEETVISQTINQFKSALKREWKNHPDKYYTIGNN